MASSLKQYEHLKITIEAIRSATNEFSDSNSIGRGGFGKVYKGELVHLEEQTMVAFKRLNRVFGQGDPEFWKEIMMLSLYRHPNIVSLVGYCDDCGEKILVYEYAQKGSLDLYLDSNELSWIRRLKICIGAARGLAYLHTPTGNQLRVLHRDIKSSNILLDENWDAKISDFGLSKFGPANQQFTFLVSNAVGTVGYCDPLYVETGLLTKESDVYSFGVVLFELLCGRLCIGNETNKHRPLTGLARRCYEENKLQEIIHSNIKDEINPKSLETFAKIAYRCLKRDREERPLMTEIVHALETAINYQDGTFSITRGKSLLDVDEVSGDGEDLPVNLNSVTLSEFDKQQQESKVNAVSDGGLRVEGLFPMLKCRVLGAYFEKLGSKSFAVYSIEVRDAYNNTWFVNRRYKNFERLHRRLKIPNYMLQLPPNMIVSSSKEDDAFVHQLCLQLHKYMQDLLSVTNVAEQHEVWDFLSVSSKNYSFGKSSSSNTGNIDLLIKKILGE